MKISVKAKPNSKKAFIKKIDTTHFIVAVNEPPVERRANKAIVKSLSEYLKIPQSSIIIISGENVKQKIIEIPLSPEDLEKIENEKNPQLKIWY